MAEVPRALRIATEAHAGQTDLAGEPYLWHCLRVMEGADEFVDSDRGHAVLRSTALLHDTLEDTSWTKTNLMARSVSEIVASTVVVLTHQDDLTYEQYIERISDAGTVPCIVKIADLRDNLDLSRLRHVTEDDAERARKYQDALVKLRRAVNS